MILGSRIRDPEKTYSGSRIPDPGVKKHPIPDPGSGSATLLRSFFKQGQNYTEPQTTLYLWGLAPVLWILIWIRNFQNPGLDMDPEKIIPDPGSSGSKVNFK
jgi:hypothetical protein